MPEVQSPRALDDQILAEARNLAPVKRRFFPVSWMPAMATACAVALAIVVARPLLQDLDPAVEFEATLPASIQVQTSSDSVLRIADDDAESRKKVAPDYPVLLEDTLISLDNPEVKTATVELQKMRVQKEELNEQSQLLDVVSQPAPELLESETTGAAFSSAVPQEATGLEAISEESSEISPEYITRQMDEIRKLLSENKTGEAQAMLDLLIRECPDCDLPESIEEME
jgi:hypothetical protein